MFMSILIVSASPAPIFSIPIRDCPNLPSMIEYTGGGRPIPVTDFREEKRIRLLSAARPLSLITTGRHPGFLDVNYPANPTAEFTAEEAKSSARCRKSRRFPKTSAIMYDEITNHMVL